jgi:hypothetical protein
MKTKLLLLAVILATLFSSCNQGRKQILSKETAIYFSLDTLKVKNEKSFESIKQIYSTYPEIQGGFITQAGELKERSDEAFDFILAINKELIIFADGEDSPALMGSNILIYQVTHLNNTLVPQNILLGADKNGKAYAIKAVLNDYKSFLISIAEDDPGIIDKINSVLDLSNKKSVKSDEAEMNWVDYSFKNKSLGEVLILLYSLQNDVRSLESDVLTLIIRNLNKTIK